MTRRAFTGWDAAVVAAVLALNAGLLLALRSGTPAALEVTSDAGRQVVPLEPSGRLEVPGPLGPAVVEVGRFGGRFASSPCPNQLCVRAGPVRRPGEVAACLPSRIAIRVLRAGAAPEEDVDAVAR